jgi:MurNAc alpha-1-phosphate uridylyltransferase
MIAMILAAGRGERLRPATDRIPKALVEVRGQSLIERHLVAIHTAGIETVVINLGWLGDAIVDRVASGCNYGLNVIYSPEGDDILETGGGIQRALPLLGDEPFLVVNADIYTDMPFPPPAPAANALAHLALVPNPPHREHGDFNLNDGLVCASDEAPFTFSGVAIYRSEFFADCMPGRFPLAPMLYDAVNAGRISGSLYEGLWEDVGTPARLEELNRRCN